MPKQSVTFTTAHRDIFQKLSSDSNPLHCDSAYARCTPFGEVILHGMAAVVHAIGTLTTTSSIRLEGLQGQFRKPVLLEKEHHVRLENIGTGCTSIVMMRGAEVIMRLRVDWTPWEPDDHEAITLGHDEFQPVDRALKLDLPPSASKHMRYCLATQFLDEFARLFSLRARFIPLDQLAGVLWSSYHVGMIWPGRQALFSSFALKFMDGNPIIPCLDFDELDMGFDPRFDLASVHARCPGMRAETKALSRPVAVSYSPMEIAESARRISANLNGQSAIVIGGSRGFGSIVARMLAYLGASVTVLSRSNIAQVENDFSDMSDSPGQITVIRGDAGDPHSYSALQATEPDQQRRFDILVCNASPPIIDTTFAGMDPSDFQSYVSDTISLYQAPIFSLDKLLDDHATIVNVSSAYVKSIRSGFSHYITAKSAIEGMTRVLAAEYPDRSFLIFRAPRMLTDQTNVNNDPEEKQSAVHVAKSLVSAVCSIRDSNLQATARDGPNLLVMPAN